MKRKFRFLVFTLVVCVCAISVSAEETKSVKTTYQLSIKKTVCQQRANQLFQPTQIAQFKYARFKTPTLARTKNGLPREFTFAMPKSNLALQIDGTEEIRPPIDWACYLACRLYLDPEICYVICIMN